MLSENQLLDLYRVDGEDGILSPALLYYDELIERNTRAAIDVAGGADRLWPHVKSHKTARLIDMQRALGIDRFKCATLCEAEMTASRGAGHVLLAYPLVGPNIDAYLDLAARWPKTVFYALEDSMPALKALDAACGARQMTMNWLCDVNVGMDRTGVPADGLVRFIQDAASLKNVRFMGLHCYDGQNHQTEPETRQRAVETVMAPVDAAKKALTEAGIDVPIVISGGSPSYPCHAKAGDGFLSPGTVFLWDWGYMTNFPELPFVPAGVILTRVISHPGKGLFTLDCGSKAISTDNPARGHLLGVPGAEMAFQSEEHWVWRMPAGREDERPPIGQAMYVVPMHICPTNALYDHAVIITDHHIAGRCAIAARHRLAPEGAII